MSLRVLAALAVLVGMAGGVSAQDGGSQQKESAARGGKKRVARDVEFIGPMRILMRELELDDDQKADVTEIWLAHSQAEKALRESLQPPREIAEKMGELRRQMRAAHDARDKERVQTLRAELEKLQVQRTEIMMPLREKLGELQDKLHDDLRGVMREDQLEVFERVWTEQLDRREVRKTFMRSPNALKSAVDRLKGLSAGQKEAIQQLFEGFKRWTRDAKKDPAGYAAERKARIKKLYDEVLAQLTPEQRETITDRLYPDRSRNRKHGHDPRPQSEAKEKKPGEKQSGGKKTEEQKPEGKKTQAKDTGK